jgi:pyruvate dehydrogenase E1 component
VQEGFEVHVFSVTSWSELARDGAASTSGQAYIAQQVTESQGPIIAATDYVRAVPDSVRAWLPAGRTFTTLGTDGFGRSDTRAALRAFFNVDAASIVRTAHLQTAQQPT